MAFTFLVFILLAALFTMGMTYVFPVGKIGVQAAVADPAIGEQRSWGAMLVDFFTVGEFYMLLSRKSMLALLVFSFCWEQRCGSRINWQNLFMISWLPAMK